MQKKWVDFKAVKAAVSMDAVLKRYGVKVYRANNDHVRGKCPLPSHTSTESKLSFVANITKNVWSCKSASCVAAREGDTGGNVLDFVALMEGCSIREAAERLAEWYAIPAAPENIPGVQRGVPPKAEDKTELVAGSKPATEKEVRGPEPETGETTEENKPLAFSLRGIDSGHPYLAKRGITRATAEFFGVGFFPGKGSMQGRVVFPIHNPSGELIAYAGRSIDDSEPRYKLPEGFKKSLVLYNLHRVGDLADTVIVVEGFFGAMRIHQCGFPNVVGLMGWSLSEAQEELLARFKRVVLLHDGDDAGRGGTSQNAARLVHKVFVRAIDLPDGAQPDQLSDNEIRALLTGCL